MEKLFEFIKQLCLICLLLLSFALLLSSCNRNQEILLLFKSAKGDYNNIKAELNNEKVNDLYQFFLLISRPIQLFIFGFINNTVILTSNTNYFNYSVSFLTCNIIVDSLLIYIIHRYVIGNAILINNNFKTLIDCLKI